MTPPVDWTVVQWRQRADWVQSTREAAAEVQSAPFVIRIKLDDQTLAQRLPAGSTGLAAICTDRVKASHVIRQVVLRQTAILNYVMPF